MAYSMPLAEDNKYNLAVSSTNCFPALVEVINMVSEELLPLLCQERHNTSIEATASSRHAH
jgi:hypothetical protein